MKMQKSFGPASIILGALATTVGLTLLIISFPVLGTLVLGAIVLCVVTWFMPDVVLGASLVLTLMGGDFAQFIVYGNLAIVFAGMLSLIFLLGDSRPSIFKPLILPLLLILIMALRYAAEGDFNSLTRVLFPGATLFLVAFCISKERNISRALALSGLLYILVTVLIGGYDYSGTRFMGVTGNPNRMSFALLIYLPFLLHQLLKSRNIVVKFLYSTGLVLSVGSLIASQSSQAIAGLLLIGLGLLWTLVMRLSIVTRYVIGVTALSLSILFYFQVWPEIQVDDDLSTLSGRTPLYEVAWAEFLREPLYGTGETDVSDGVIVDRSAHSSLLGFLAYGGVMAGLPWLFILFRMLLSGVVGLNRSSVLGIVPVIFIVIQGVQSVEYMTLTWVVVAYFSYPDKSINNIFFPYKYLRGKETVWKMGGELQ